MPTITARSLTLVSLGLVLATLACTLGPAATSAPTSTVVSEATPTAPATDTAPPAETDTALPADTPTLGPTLAPPTPTQPEVPQAPLAAEGPWLLLTAPDGYWALNPDGSGLTHLMAPPPYFSPGPAAPAGGHVAFVGSDHPSGDRGLRLYTLSLPQAETVLVTALTGPTTEPGPEAQPGDEAFARLFPAGQSAWSPDGQRLAFIGLMDGPSADLYLYSLDGGTITRLTDGPSQAYQPSWSPDGQFVVQTGAESFGTGAGYSMAGVWAVRADNTEVIPLYTPTSGDERLHGWLSASEFVVDSFRAQCSYGDLRVFDLSTLAFSPLFPSYYNALALDTTGGRALVAVDVFVADCPENPSAGLYLAAPNEAPRLLAAGDASRAVWLPEAELFFGTVGEEWLAFTAEGEPRPLPGGLTDVPWVAPGGQHWAWRGPEGVGLFVSQDGAPARPIFDGYVQLATWSPDGQTLLFDGDGTFYAAYAPDFIPAPIAMGLLDPAYASTLTWVEKGNR